MVYDWMAFIIIIIINKGHTNKNTTKKTMDYNLNNKHFNELAPLTVSTKIECYNVTNCRICGRSAVLDCM